MIQEGFLYWHTHCCFTHLPSEYHTGGLPIVGESGFILEYPNPLPRYAKVTAAIETPHTSIETPPTNPTSTTTEAAGIETPHTPSIETPPPTIETPPTNPTSTTTEAAGIEVSH